MKVYKCTKRCSFSKKIYGGTLQHAPETSSYLGSLRLPSPQTPAGLEGLSSECQPPGTQMSSYAPEYTSKVL